MPEKPPIKYHSATKPVPGSNSITPEGRARAIAYLKYYLSNAQSMPYGTNKNGPPRQYNKANTGESMKGLQEDPQADLAIISLLNQYPHIAKNIASTLTGAALPPGVEGEITSGVFSPHGGGHIALRPHSQQNMSVWDTMRHEMSHAIGYPDIDNPDIWATKTDAYDIGRASEDLHRDIQLPGITPPKPIKRRGKK